MPEAAKPIAPNVNERSGITRFPDAGWADFGRILEPKACAELRQWIDTRRPMQSDIFYQTQEEFRTKGRWDRHAPGRADHNLLLTERLDLRFIEENEHFRRHAEALVGPGYGIMKKSVIRSVPSHVVPKWLLELVAEVGRPNLNPFIRDEFQDIQLFLHTDFHQDKTRPESDFVTVYIYLDDVGSEYSSVHLLEGSHVLGMTHYPHSLRRSHIDRNQWFYSDLDGNHQKCKAREITADAGTVFSWHCMTLHGTVMNSSKDPRISLRYLLTKSPDCHDDTLLDQANRQVIGQQRIVHARLDQAQDGTFLQTGSSLLSYD